jgi:hypothetical protein
MAFTPISVGTILALPCMGYFDKIAYNKARTQDIASGTEVKPEERLHSSVLGVKITIMPVPLLW